MKTDMRCYLLITAVAGLLTSGTGASAREAWCIARFNGGCIWQGETGTCSLRIGRRKFIRGPCYVEMDSNGSFSMGPDNRRNKYIAYTLHIDEPNKAKGFWADMGAEGNARPLGILTRHGACWSNDHAEMCAWRK